MASRSDLSLMLVAGEASGDLLAAELVDALAACDRQPPICFGAGGPKMAAAGVEIAVDLTEHSMIGLTEAVRNYGTFRRLFRQLVQLAVERQPDAIVCVDFSGFNGRFARAIRAKVVEGRGQWNPRIIQYVSPQVWASRPGRARAMARDLDLLLAIFPFEPAWYAERVPELRVEFVGHPMLDRYASTAPRAIAGADPSAGVASDGRGSSLVLLLPGSRVGEVRRHLPVIVGAARAIGTVRPDVRFRLVVPDVALQHLAEPLTASLPGVDSRVGGLAESLAEADLAIASTGTVTMECAYFGVPAIALYKTSWSTYQIGKRIITVKHLAMPNLLAGEAIVPEFIQDAATADNLARAALALLDDAPRQVRIRRRLAEVVALLGEPGASRRAAHAILAIVRGVRGE